MKVICYGDSNIYGFDPRGWLGERYGADDRWVDILARRTGWEILNCTPAETVQRMLDFLAGLTVGHDKILLIAPPPGAFGAWVQEQRLIDASAERSVQ